MTETSTAAAAQLRSISPYFLVKDVVRAAEYYRDRLGFAINGYVGKPPVFSIVSRDQVEIFLKRDATTRAGRSVNPDSCWEAYVHVADVDAIYAEFQQRGATIHRGLCPTEYGMKELEVADADGYILCFASPLQAAA